MVDTLKLQGREQSYGNHHHFMDYATTHILRVKIKEKVLHISGMGEEKHFETCPKQFCSP